MDLGYERTVKEVSTPEEGLSGSGNSTNVEKRFSEVDEWGCACWRNNAEIDFEIDPVREEDDDWIGPDLKT